VVPPQFLAHLPQQLVAMRIAQVGDGDARGVEGDQPGGLGPDHFLEFLKVRIDPHPDVDGEGHQRREIGDYHRTRIAFAERTQRLRRLETHQHIGVPVGDDRALGVAENKGGLHHAAALGHAVDFAHTHRDSRQQGGLSENARCQQVALPANRHHD